MRSDYEDSRPWDELVDADLVHGWNWMDLLFFVVLAATVGVCVGVLSLLGV